MKYGKGRIMLIGYDIDERAEREFKEKCQEFNMYSPVERTTLDNEWTEQELIDDIYDTCVEIMTPELLKKYEHRALINPDLLKTQYMANTIANQIEDVIELYNKEYDKHRNERAFGIRWYDEAIKKMINKKLKENMVCR